MKKIYLLFTLLLTMLGTATTMFAQDEVSIPVNMNNGKWTDWNGRESNPWARSWYSTTTPAISILCIQGGNTSTDIRGNVCKSSANNMSVWDESRTELMFFTNYGTYEIMVEEGWYISSVEFDFDCANDKNQKDGAITLTLGDSEPATSSDVDDIQHVAWENSDDEVYSVQFIVNRDEGTYNFARTRNFYVTVKKMSEAKAAMQALQQTLNTYQDYKFLTGTEPGNYGEAEVAAFFATIDAAYDAEGDPELEKLPDAELAATYRAMAKAIVDAYDAVVASRNTVFPVADGYYRIKTGMEYTQDVIIGQDEDGNDITESQAVDKYLTSYMNGTKFYAYYETPEDMTTDCTSLWKITNKDGYLDIQNMATDCRFDDMFKYNVAVPMSLTSENLMQFEPVATVDGTTYFNIRVMPREGDAYQYENMYYYHQYGHQSGAGKGGTVGLYYTSLSINDNNEPVMGGSEWQLVPVDDATAEELMKAYEPIKDEKLRSERYKLMLADAKEKLEVARDREELIKDISQVTFVKTDPSEGSEAAILDNDPATFWHSDWHNKDSYGRPSLTVELEEPVEEFLWRIVRRASANDHVTKGNILAGNDVEDLAVVVPDLVIENGSNGASFETVINLGAPYKFVKFEFTESNKNTRGVKNPEDETEELVYAHFAEFHMLSSKVGATTQYTVLGDIAKNLDDVLTAQAEVNPAKVTAEEYNAMKAAYDAFIEKFVDPTELRNVLAEYSGVGEGVVVGTQPGYWKDENAGVALNNVVAAAQAYDASGAYTQEQSDKYVADVKAQAEAVYAAAIQIQEGKWYRIRFASEEDFEAHGWNKNAGYVAPAEDQPEINAPLFGKYVTVANWVQTDEETGAYDLEMFEEDVPSFIGENLFFMDDASITKKDMALFRFIAVGDSAYLLQNKATGLFVKAAGTSGAVRLNVQPSVFNTRAVGYGLNVIASRNLVGGIKENYLHGQKSNNVLVTWDASAPGSASAMYIEEAGDVEADFANTANVGIKYGAVNAFCYPFEVSEIADGQAWGVTSVEGNKISLCQINGAINAGRPFIYINGETEDYDAEAEAEPVAFTFNTNAIVTEAQNDGALKGTFSTLKIDRGDVYCKDNALVVNKVGKDDIMVTYTYVNANSAYIAGETPFDPQAELEVVWDENAEDGVQTALQNVVKSGIIYTLDGRVAGKGNLNNVKNLGRGIYILNGTKVVVK